LPSFARLAGLAAIAAVLLAAAAALAGPGGCGSRTTSGLLLFSRGGCGLTRMTLAVPPGLDVEVIMRGQAVIDARPLGWEARVLHTAGGVYVVPSGIDARRLARFSPALFNVEAVARVFANGRPLGLEVVAGNCTGHGLHMLAAGLRAAGVEPVALHGAMAGGVQLLRVIVDEPWQLRPVYRLLAEAECVVAVSPGAPDAPVDALRQQAPTGALPDGPPRPLYAVWPPAPGRSPSMILVNGTG